MQVTGQDIRSTLARQLNFASENMQEGLDKNQVAAGRLLCTTANSITSSLRAEIAGRKQLMTEGKNPEDMKDIGSMVMA